MHTMPKNGQVAKLSMTGDKDVPNAPEHKEYPKECSAKIETHPKTSPMHPSTKNIQKNVAPR
jgi:hypothetical protein